MVSREPREEVTGERSPNARPEFGESDLLRPLARSAAGKEIRGALG